MATNSTVAKMIADHNRGHHISKAKARNVPEIGTWGFITGSRMIQQDFWNKNYPQGIFGRVVDYELRGKSIYLIVRTYQAKRKDFKRHNNSKVEVTFFKPL